MKLLKTYSVLLLLVCITACGSPGNPYDYDADPVVVDIVFINGGSMFFLRHEDFLVDNVDFNEFEVIDVINCQGEGSPSPSMYDIGPEVGFYYADANGRIGKYALNGDFIAQPWTAERQTPYVSSTCVSNNGLYVANTTGELAKLNNNDGSEIWSYTIPSAAAIYSSPIELKYENQVAFGADDGNIYIVKDGQLDWSFDTGGVVKSSPALFAPSNNSSEYDQLVIVGSNSGSVFALDVQGENVAWHFDTGSPVESSPYITDAAVIVGSDNGKVYALDTLTGAVMWEFQTDGPVKSSPTFASFIANPGNILVGSDDGYMYSIEATTGQLQWKTNLNAGPIRSSPITRTYLTYVNTELGLFCLDNPTGEILLRFEQEGSGYSSPVAIRSAERESEVFDYIPWDSSISTASWIVPSIVPFSEHSFSNR